MYWPTPPACESDTAGNQPMFHSDQWCVWDSRKAEWGMQLHSQFLFWWTLQWL
ncbi:uncharacterized protein CTRU02_201459 [Colletotrichum truncatum]|uniref:Uncharacterized protein n=1 Tax=Colletotrichum truncatum TaxID=5467 RepID=A0ACC3ZHF3_COLTU|nr:uncharacterized protein CTRU02_14330 [Colletotrichum truncatum]KAF6782291.1 hypothetical protein CTRU02_14330 [Colletotrichum truncatum]